MACAAGGGYCCVPFALALLALLLVGLRLVSGALPRKLIKICERPQRGTNSGHVSRAKRR